VFHSNHSHKQVGVQPPPSALDVTLPAFAGERRRLMHRAHISCPHGAQQQTRRPPPLLLSIDGTDRQTDVRPLQGPCSACYASSVSDITGAHGPCQYQLSFVAGNTTRRPLTPSVVLTLSALSADAERGLRIGTVSVRSSVCLSRLPAAASCGGFAAVGPAGRRYRYTAARPAVSSKMRAVPRCQRT